MSWTYVSFSPFRSFAFVSLSDAKSCFSGSVYDVSSRATFEELTRWMHELETYTAPDVVKIVVGNKVSLERDDPFF